jgi:cytochrome c oxidase cbb3-type subunit 3
MTVRRDEIQGDIVHVCDGIEEADNKLPNWWLWTFYLAIIFSILYWGYYHLFGVGDAPMASYLEDQKKVLARGANVEEEVLVTAAQDPAAVAQGEKLFVDNCAQCHLQNGSGDIGPNLTDEFWIHGGGPVDIYGTIYKGVLDKGMLAWGPTLGPGGVRQVTAYVMTLRNTNVPGKEPEGEKWVPGQEPSPAPTGKEGAAKASGTGG